MTTQFPDLSLTAYQPPLEPKITTALCELIDVTPTWLDEAGLIVVTAAIHAHLVGYVAATVADGTLTIIDTFENTWAAGHPELLASLVEKLLEAADRPWVEIRIDRKNQALTYLVGQAGWEPTGVTAEPDQLVLSGAHAA